MMQIDPFDVCKVTNSGRYRRLCSILRSTNAATPVSAAALGLVLSKVLMRYDSPVPAVPSLEPLSLNAHVL